jgi:endonuclease/exonuclease/phosphatase family metal-dependent hydrolase
VKSTPAAVLLCGDFNTNYGTEHYSQLREMLRVHQFDRLQFDSTVPQGKCPITFPSNQTSLDFAFVRGIGGTVTCFDNQRLSDHNGLRITLDDGLVVLCFNAHFGTDATMTAQDAATYARLIDTSGASVVCMQEIDAKIGYRTQADEIQGLLAGPWDSKYYGARPMNLPRTGEAGRLGYASKWGSEGGGGGGGVGHVQ